MEYCYKLGYDLNIFDIEVSSSSFWVPQKRWMVDVRENPIQMDDKLGVPHLWKPPNGRFLKSTRKIKKSRVSVKKKLTVPWLVMN